MTLVTIFKYVLSLAKWWDEFYSLLPSRYLLLSFLFKISTFSSSHIPLHLTACNISSMALIKSLTNGFIDLARTSNGRISLYDLFCSEFFNLASLLSRLHLESFVPLLLLIFLNNIISILIHHFNSYHILVFHL